MAAAAVLCMSPCILWSEKLFIRESVTLPMCLRRMETCYCREVWWIIFSRYFQVLVCIKLCVNLHLQFILRAKVNICFLVIFKTDCCRYFSFAVVSAIQLHHQHLLKFFLGFLLGFLYPIQICHRLHFLSLQATLSAFSMSSVSVSGISFCWCSLRITKPLPCYSNTFCTQLISLWSKCILEGN